MDMWAISGPMRPSDQLAQYVRRATSVREVGERAGVPRRSVQGLLDGHTPSLDRAADIAAALGLELYIGPPRGSAPPAPVAPAPAPPAPDIGSARAGESAPAPLPVPVRDRALAELLTAVVRRWESLPPAERGYLVADLWAAGGSGLRAQSRRATSSPGSAGG